MKYNQIEKLLYDYQNNKARIKSIALMLNTYDIAGANALSEKSSRTNAFSSSVENAVINNQGKRDLLRSEKRTRENDVELVDILLESLNVMQRRIIRLKYFDKYAWCEVSEIVKYSVSHCKRIRRTAIDNMVNVSNEPKMRRL